MAGQIHTGWHLGNTLEMLAKQSHVRDVLEVGTYNGEGSTYLLARALQASGGTLRSIEAREDHFGMAREFYRDKQLPVELLHGLSLGRDAHEPFEHYWPMIRRTVHEAEYPGDYRKWYEEELDLARRAQNERILERLLDDLGGFDMVLLDGGEFLSDAEFELLEPHIRHYIVMDDTNPECCIKNGRSRERVLASPDWEVLVDAIDERNGWLAARRVR